MFVQARLQKCLAVAVLLALVVSTSTNAQTKPKYLDELERQANSSLLFLFDSVPGTRQLVEDAAGVLVIPVVTKAAFVFGGAYGEGVLLIDNQVADYYASVQGNFGLQAGAHQTSQVLVFTTDAALDEFRKAQNFVLGARSDFVLFDESRQHGTDTMKGRTEIVAITFGKSGLLFGSSISGTKYSRLDKSQS